MSSIALFLVSFIAFFVLGMPIAAAMIIGLNNFALVAIPLFILTAEVMNRTSVSDSIFKLSS